MFALPASSYSATITRGAAKDTPSVNFTTERCAIYVTRYRPSGRRVVNEVVRQLACIGNTVPKASEEFCCVAVVEMGGHGSFSDPRIGINITQEPDLVTPKLPALLQYQLSLAAPRPPAGTFDRMAAKRGEALFNTKAGCASCHTPPTFTDVLSGPDPNIPFLHDPAEVGTDPLYAQRSATKQYRTTPLRALWQHAPYFHDGSAPDLMAVVNHYDVLFNLGLTQKQKQDLVEYLKSI